MRTGEIGTGEGLMAHVFNNVDAKEKTESKAEGQERHPGTPVGTHR